MVGKATLEGRDIDGPPDGPVTDPPPEVPLRLFVDLLWISENTDSRLDPGVVPAE